MENGAAFVASLVCWSQLCPTSKYVWTSHNKRPVPSLQ